MTELRDTPHVVHAETNAEHHGEQSHARYRIATKLTDGKPADVTHLRDALGGPEAVNGRVKTSTLRALAAALIEHADAVDLFRSTYREAEYQVPDPKPVEVFPGFPGTMTTSDHTKLEWPDGVRARDRDGDVWQYVVDAERWVFTPPDEDPNLRDTARIRNNLPASIIPTSWPKADTTPEN